MSKHFSEGRTGDTVQEIHSKHEIQISPEDMELILIPDEELAKLELDRQIMTAENNPNILPRDMQLLRFQRQLVFMQESEAHSAGLEFAESTGQFATYSQNTMGNSRYPTLWRPIMRGLVVSDAAAAARWQILGVDDPIASYGAAVLYIEGGWRYAARARKRADEANAQAVSLAHSASKLPLI